MGKKLFIPLVILLVVLAFAIYWIEGRDHKPRSVRETVPVKHYTLNNGLQLVIMPNERIPAVAHILFVRAGGGDDPYGKSGVAHYIEHLMFTGTQEYPEGAYDKEIARLGGKQNAYTTRDYTAYYATIAKEHLTTIMAMEADRLQHLVFNEAKAKRELQVILEERNMRVENSAPALLAEQLDAITFFNHPYRQPLIGWKEDMEGLRAADAEAFFRRHYRASNMVLVITGDVDIEETRRLAQRYYGELPGGKAPERAWPKEPPLRITRHAEMEDEKAHERRLMRQYTAPSIVEGDSAAAMPLALLAQYLGGSTTGLLYQQLVVEQKLASSVSAYYDPLSMGPGIFRIQAVPMRGVSLKELETALDRLLESVLGVLPDEADVARAKTQLKADVIYAQDGLEPLAHLIGQLYMLGRDEQYFYEWSDAVEAVSASQMLEAAQKVLDPRRRVTGYLQPLHAEAPPMESEAEPEMEAEAADAL